MGGIINILLVEDNLGDRLLFRRAVKNLPSLRLMPD
jgi:hypothetical protein